MKVNRCPKERMNSGKYSVSKVARAGVDRNPNVLLIVLIRQTVPNVFLLEPNRIFPVFRVKNLSKDFKNITKMYRNRRMLLQMNIGHILLMAGILNFRDKALTQVFSQGVFRRD